MTTLPPCAVILTSSSAFTKPFSLIPDADTSSIYTFLKLLTLPDDAIFIPAAPVLLIFTSPTPAAVPETAIPSAPVFFIETTPLP